MINISICLIEKNLVVLENFFDYKKDNFEKDFKFVRDVGVTFQHIFQKLLKKIKKNGQLKIKKCTIKKEEDMQNLIYYMTEEQSLDYKLVEILREY